MDILKFTAAMVCGIVTFVMVVALIATFLAVGMVIWDYGPEHVNWAHAFLLIATETALFIIAAAGMVWFGFDTEK